MFGFEYVTFSAPCWGCGKPLNSWQTKNDVYNGGLIATVHHPELQVFYAACPCGTWNQYKKVEPAHIEIRVTKEAAFERDIEGEEYYNKSLRHRIVNAPPKEK